MSCVLPDAPLVRTPGQELGGPFLLEGEAAGSRICIAVPGRISWILDNSSGTHFGVTFGDVYAAYIATLATHSILESLTSSAVILLDVAAFFVWMSNINYASDVLCRARRGRPLPKANPATSPSCHCVPAYNEPPELLIETIKALERIDYPNYEVVIIDNNTSDPAVWEPVAAYCEGRERVKFIHVAPWPGYKAGACNLVLRQYTDPRAEIIGLVDADDIVKPYYLREVAPYFSDPSIGFVQTFEGNRDFQGSHYYQACVDSFQAFYLSVMSSRNERNTVPFVGTMGLFRRSALVAAGGWNEWCICEDTEVSLRVTRNGWDGLYIPRCFGRGVVPPSFRGMLTQRHRWCFGAMQILRLHWKSLMPWDRSPENRMSSAQRRDFLMASLGWFRDLLMSAFSALLLVITGLLVTQSHFTVSPMDGTRSIFPLALIVVATLANMFALRLWTTMSFRRAIMSLLISLSVSWVIALGCIEGASGATRSSCAPRRSAAADASARRSGCPRWKGPWPSTEPHGRLPGSADPGYDLGGFLAALDAQTTARSDPDRVHDDAGIVVIGGFSQPATDRAARIAAAREQVRQKSAEHEDSNLSTRLRRGLPNAALVVRQAVAGRPSDTRSVTGRARGC